MKDSIINFVQQYAWFLGVLALLGIEISPIKINPLKWALKGLGKLFSNFNNSIHSDINKTLNTIVDRLDKMEKDSDFKDIMEVKNKLVNYKVLLQTTGLDEHQYARCFELIERYKFYQTKYEGEVNGHMTSVMKYIENQYQLGNIIKSEEDESV